MNLIVLEMNSLGPVKFYLFMMLYLTAIVWWARRTDA